MPGLGPSDRNAYLLACRGSSQVMLLSSYPNPKFPICGLPENEPFEDISRPSSNPNLYLQSSALRTRRPSTLLTAHFHWRSEAGHDASDVGSWCRHPGTMAVWLGRSK